jgi:uncharacterized cupin superfamily protein
MIARVDEPVPRRIVTGTTADGASYLARVEEVEEVEYPIVLPPTPKGFDSATTATAFGAAAPDGARHSGFFRIWATDWLPVPFPTDGRAPFIGSEPTPDETPQALRRASILPPPLGVRIGLGTSAPSPVPGRLHWTDSTDILFIMSGKHGQILDDGAVLLHPGDVLVQNGTNHSHQTMESAVIGYVTLSAMRTSPPPPIELLNPVSGPLDPYRAGYRPPETREKEAMAEWQVPGASPREYPADGSLPDAVEQLERPRRVVTGTNTAGESYFSRVEAIDEIEYTAPDPQARIWRIWAIDRLPDLVPTEGLAPPLLPAVRPDETSEALRRRPVEPGPLGMDATVWSIGPSGEPGPVRRRSCLDAVFVMGGELTLVLDEGQVPLRRGDVVIQNGTAHRWHNRGETQAVLGVASFGAAVLAAR